MPTVADLTAPYGNLMLNPRAGSGVCRVCFNLTKGYVQCYACAHQESRLAAMAPISYSVSGGQLHHVLAAYKRLNGAVAERMAVELAAVLWRYLELHEGCLARAAKVDGFALVTTVPPSDRARAADHPLSRIVESFVGPTRARYQRLLRRSAAESAPHEFDSARFEPLGQLDGQPVLLIDDTWTTGANAQSAAHALRIAGAAVVAAVVIGRYVNGEWHQNRRQLAGMGRPFDWTSCAWCATQA